MAVAKKEEVANKEITVAEQAVLTMMRGGGAKKKSGLGGMWGNVTESVGETFGGITVLARAGRILAEQAEAHALIGKAESNNELLAAYGFEELEGLQAVAMAAQLKIMLRNA